MASHAASAKANLSVGDTLEGMAGRGWSLGLLAVAACGRLQFEDRPSVGDGPAGDVIGGDVPSGDTSGMSAIARVQKEPATLTPIKCVQQSTCSAAFSSPTSAGNMIVVVVTLNDITARAITSVVDDQGGTYPLVVDRATLNGNNWGLAAIYYRENVPAASPLTVTVSTDQITYIDLAIVEYSGMPATGALTAINTNACAACGIVDAGTLADGGLSVGVFTTANADVQSITMAPGWDPLASESTPLTAVIGAEDRIGPGNAVASWTTGFTGPKVGVSAKFGL